MEKNIQKVLISQEQIRAKVKELASQISAEYADKDPVFVGVLKGVVIFFADMVREISIPCEIDFMCLSSYGGTNSSGNVVVKKDLSVDIKGRHVVILEDIYDTGRSLDFTRKYLLSKEPASLKICTLLDKPARRKSDITADYVEPVPGAREKLCKVLKIMLTTWIANLVKAAANRMMEEL